MSFEQVLVLVVFMLVPLLNFLLRALRRRVARSAPEEPTPAAPPPPVVRRREATGRSAALPAPRPEAVGARRRPRLGLGGAQEVRRAFVLMAVLGPCRGQEPPGPRMPDAPPDRVRR